MTKNIFITIVYIALCSPVFTQIIADKKADKDTKKWRYEIEAAGEGKDGSYLLKVWSYSKKANIAIEQAKKNAIHGVIFQGVIGSGNISGQPPFTSNPGLEQQHADFFNDFFRDGGNYGKYISISNDGSVSPGDRKRVDNEYKIAVLVSVRKDLLRKALEDAGVLKNLSSGF